MKQFCLFFILLIGPAWAEYNLKDLEVLYQEHEYVDFFAHAKEIRPSERTPYWQEMVQNSAQGLLEKWIRTPAEANLTLLSELLQWPILQKDDFLSAKTHTLLLSQTRYCLKTKKAFTCYQEIKPHWEKQKFDPDFSVRLVELLLPASNFDSEAQLNLDFHGLIYPALKHELSEFYCKKPFVQDLILNEAVKKDLVSDQELVQYYKSLHADCLPQFKNRIRDLAQTDSKYTSSAIKISLMSGEPSEELQLLYLLRSPRPSNWLNLSWTTLEKLSGEAFTREEILSDFKKLDPLPDTIFTGENKLSAHLTKLFAKHFPEYVDFYAHTCLDYLSGTRSFPQGNPTPHCFEFKDFAKKEHLLPVGVIHRIEKLQKL